MKNSMRTTAVVIAIAVSACAHYRYSGEIDVKDSEGVDRKARLGWTKTSKLFREQAPTTLELLTQCGKPLQFTQRPEGIVYRGNAGEDEKVIGTPASGQSFVCGKLQVSESMTDLGEGPLAVSIQCKPVNSEFSTELNRYIQARNDPYIFPIKEEKSYSLLGKTPELEPYSCPDVP